jgi:hypothetical protein
MTDKTVSVPQQAPILEEPFTHAEVNQYYSDMYIHVMKEDRKMPLDMKTLIEVHNFFEFETNSGMMLDAWLHAQLQKLGGKSYIPTAEEAKLLNKKG